MSVQDMIFTPSLQWENLKNIATIGKIGEKEEMKRKSKDCGHFGRIWKTVMCLSIQKSMDLEVYNRSWVQSFDDLTTTKRLQLTILLD